MKQKNSTSSTIQSTEVGSQRQHWFYTTSWWTITSLLFCLVFIGSGIDALSLYWADPTEDSFWKFLIGLNGLLGAMTGTCAFLVLAMRRLGFARNYKKSLHWKYASRLLGACFVFALIGVMIPIFKPPSLRISEASERQRAKDALNQPWLSHQISDGIFSLQTPANWKLQSEGVSGMQMIDEANGILMAVSTTPKIDLAATSLPELHDMALNNFKLSGAEVESFRRSEIGGQVDRLFQDMMVTYVSQSEKSQSFIRHIDFPDHWVSVFFQFRPSKLDSNIHAMLQIADSVWYLSSNDYVLERYDGKFLQSGQNNSFPMRMFVLRKDGTGRIEGVMNWPSLDFAATRFEGTLTGNRFSFTEHEVLAGSHRVVVPVYHEGTIQGVSVNGKATFKGTVSTYQLDRVESQK